MIIPSIASADQIYIAEALDCFEGHPIHVDIEDGNFTPNITFGLKTVKRISEYCKGRLDVHLFVTNPDYYVDALASYGIWGMAFQVEGDPFPLRVINHIRDCGMKAGIGLNIMTAIEMVEMFVESIDYMIVMTGEPDAHDMELYQPTLEKIRRLKKIVPKEVEIWADGGINRGNLPEVIRSGADHVIFGRAAFCPMLTRQELEKLQRGFSKQI